MIFLHLMFSVGIHYPLWIRVLLLIIVLLSTSQYALEHGRMFSPLGRNAVL